MKALNTMQFVANAAEEMANYKRNIEAAESYDMAKRIGNQAFGYLNCLITFLNTMICHENNDFTGDFDEVIDNWRTDIYQAVINNAVATKQDHEIIWKLLMKRDGKEV